MEDKGEEEWRRTGSSTAVQSEMMRGSVRERGKEGIFKPRCLFSFRRGVCLGVCVCACVIRVPPPVVIQRAAGTPASTRCSTLTEPRPTFSSWLSPRIFIVSLNQN